MRRIIGLLVVMMAMSFVSCSSKTNTEYGDYERCIATTSTGNMAETKDGFFYLFNEMLYYGDKTDISLFVPVCNKPDCNHKNWECNAYVPSESLVQKDGKLYGADSTKGIFEFHTDGSGRTYIMKFPSYYEEEKGNEVRGTRAMMTQNELLFFMKYLTESGMFQMEWLRFEDGEWYTVFSKQYEQDEHLWSISSGSEWNMRGDFALYSGVLSEIPVDSTNLWRMDGDEPEKINFPDDVTNYLIGSYLSGNTFRYYVANEGYYKIDLKSGKKELFSESQLKDGRGIIFNEDYMVEFNFYYGSVSEEKYLKFYNGEKWIDVTLPEELKNAKSSIPFTAVTVASDRVFMSQNKFVDILQNSTLYYFMLDSNNPELIVCDTVGDVIEESTEDGEKKDGYIDIEDIVVFDTENYLVKITEVDLHYDDPETGNEIEDWYVIKGYYENNTSKDYQLKTPDGTINGLMYSTLDMNVLKANQKGEFILILEGEERNEQLHVPLLYTREEYTDIQIPFEISYNGVSSDTVVSIYPFGEENATQYAREPQETDKVVIEDDKIKVTFVGYDTNVIENDTVLFYIENKSDEVIQLSVGESSKVNGHSIMSNTVRDNYFGINGKCFSLVSFQLTEEIETYSITEIEKYEIVCWRTEYNEYAQFNMPKYFDAFILEP